MLVSFFLVRDAVGSGATNSANPVLIGSILLLLSSLDTSYRVFITEGGKYFYCLLHVAMQSGLYLHP